MILSTVSTHGRGVIEFSVFIVLANHILSHVKVIDIPVVVAAAVVVVAAAAVVVVSAIMNKVKRCNIGCLFY